VLLLEVLSHSDQLEVSESTARQDFGECWNRWVKKLPSLRALGWFLSVIEVAAEIFDSSVKLLLDFDGCLVLFGNGKLAQNKLKYTILFQTN
jgi:hypothetical protein